MAEKTMAELIAEASPEARETYAEMGGLEQLLAPSSNPLAHMQGAIHDAEYRRATAQFADEARARAKRKADLSKEAEARAAEAHARDERDRAEAEAQLMARLRKEYPPMTDQAWNSMWPQVRADWARAEHKRRMAAFENDGEVFEQMRGVSF